VEAMKYKNPQYKAKGGRGIKNPDKHEIALILGISPRHARTLMNKCMTIDMAISRAKEDI
jgi:hypothetical protein